MTRPDGLASAARRVIVRDMPAVPASPVRFGDTLAAEVAAARPMSLAGAREAFEKASATGPLFGAVPAGQIGEQELERP